MSKAQTVVITGGSSGIGKALAKEFHSHGFIVFAGARRLAAMDELKELGVHSVELDVTIQESVDQFKLSVDKMTDGKLDYLVNNCWSYVHISQSGSYN
jgi:1-acylglycerone phosphate reductase